MLQVIMDEKSLKRRNKLELEKYKSCSVQWDNRNLKTINKLMVLCNSMAFFALMA